MAAIIESSIDIIYSNTTSYQDGLIRVILDGGSSRMFTPADAKLMDEDLEVLKVYHRSWPNRLV